MEPKIYILKKKNNNTKKYKEEGNVLFNDALIILFSAM